MQYIERKNMETSQIQQQALTNAQQGNSLANYATIYQGFAAKGIAESDIEPRVNVFTFNAWKALGRQVRKGEHGVKVCTWVPMSKRDAETGESKDIGRKPRMTTVFHVSQTEPIMAGHEVKQERGPVIPPTWKGDNFMMNEKEYYSDEFTARA